MLVLNIFMDKSSTEMKFDSLSEIIPGRDAWRIRVRVLRLWKVPSFLNPLETNSVEMVLVDEKVRWFTIYIILILFLIAFCIIVINFVEF
jgi:hypothetical protein